MQRLQSVLTQPFVCFLATHWCKPCSAVAVDVLLCCRLQKHANYRCCQRFLGPANLSLTVCHGLQRLQHVPTGLFASGQVAPMVSTASDGWSGCCATLCDAKTRGIAVDALIHRLQTCFLCFTKVCSVFVRPRTSVFGCPSASHFTLTLAWMLSKVPRVKNSVCTILSSHAALSETCKFCKKSLFKIYMKIRLRLRYIPLLLQATNCVIK